MEPKLLQILQLIRAQPLYGLIHLGVPTDELSNLAEHHYLVAMTAWAVASCATSAGADVDYERLFKLCLIHDLGEVFGGDISMPYAKLNPEAKQLATEFEAANNRYLSQYFGDSKDEFLALSKEIHEPKSIEAVLMKIADYMEVQQFNSYKHLSAAEATTFMQQKIQGKIDLIDDVTVRKALENFVGSWIDSLSDTRIFPYTK